MANLHDEYRILYVIKEELDPYVLKIDGLSGYQDFSLFAIPQKAPHGTEWVCLLYNRE